MKEYRSGRCFLGRLSYGEDLLEGLERISHEKGVEVGVFQAMGATKSAKVAAYDQERQEYRTFAIEGPRELISCMGNISLREGRVAIHAHVALADEEGRMVAGHLMPGTHIFACEVFLQELLGESLHREKDVETGLPLWRID
jgi:predicted DNA-binding protein with PD1-like motif